MPRAAVPLIGKPEFGTLPHWGLALVVIVVTLGLKFFTRGMVSTAAVLIGLIAGYLVAIVLGMVSFGRIADAAWFSVPDPLRYGFEINAAAVIGMCLMAVVSAIETVGDISGITKGGAGREASDREIAGGTMAGRRWQRGRRTVRRGCPTPRFSQNVGLVSMTGVMSRHVVSLGAVFLILAGLVPKVGAVIATMPIAVLGGGVIVMFGMVAAAGINMLSDVSWNRRNMLILAVSLSVGFGLQSVPEALQHVPGTMNILLTSGLLPAAFSGGGPEPLAAGRGGGIGHHGLAVSVSGPVDDLKSPVDLRLADDQRRRDAPDRGHAADRHDVHAQSELHATSGHGAAEFGIRFAAFAVLDDVDAPQETQAAHVADRFVALLQNVETSLKISAHLAGPFVDAVRGKHSQDGPARPRPAADPTHGR